MSVYGFSVLKRCFILIVFQGGGVNETLSVFTVLVNEIFGKLKVTSFSRGYVKPYESEFKLRMTGSNISGALFVFALGTGNKGDILASNRMSAEKCDIHVAEILQLCYIAQQVIDVEKGLRYSTHRGKGSNFPESQK